MLLIKFKYKDKMTHNNWNFQSCQMETLQECIEWYGLEKDCEHEILSVTDISTVCLYIKNVSYDKDNKCYDVTFIHPKTNGTHENITEKYYEDDVPKHILDWISNPHYLKEEIIKGDKITHIIGPFPRIQNNCISYNVS